MEKSSGVALVTKHLRQPLKGVVGVNVIAIGVDITGYSSEACWHAVDRAAAVGETIIKAVAL